MKNISRNVIESIIRSNNDEFVDSVEEKVQELIYNSVEDLSKQISYVNIDNVILQPVNELLTRAMIDDSKFVFFLGIDNAQIELNTANSTLFWKNMKERIIYAWKGSRKKKRNRKKIDEEMISVDQSSLNLYSFLELLIKSMAKFLSGTSIIYNEDVRLKIIGKDDFGYNVQIIIYPVIYNGTVFRYYAGKKKGFIEVDIEKRIKFFDEKYEKVGENLITMLKVFNLLYYNINKSFANQLFMESILCSCPDSLFADEPYKMFVKIVNYLSMADISEIKSIVDGQTPVFKDKLCGGGLGFSKMLSALIDL